VEAARLDACGSVALRSRPMKPRPIAPLALLVPLIILGCGISSHRSHAGVNVPQVASTRRWYLMVPPPLRIASTPFGWARPPVGGPLAPLSQWTIDKTFPTKKECLRGAVEKAQCVPDDDPRVKERRPHTARDA
jgi:hypothetical protein